MVRCHELNYDVSTMCITLQVSHTPALAYSYTYELALTLSQQLSSYLVPQIVQVIRPTINPDPKAISISHTSARSMYLADVWILQMYGSCRCMDHADPCILQMYGSYRCMDLTDVWLIDIAFGPGLKVGRMTRTIQVTWVTFWRVKWVSSTN